MNEFKEVTAENLRLIRSTKDLNQEEIAELLGITQTAVSKIEKGKRGISDSEKHLLDWYFFNKIPPRLTNTMNLKGCLEFSEGEWRVLSKIASNNGQTAAQYIISTIRFHLDPLSPKEWPKDVLRHSAITYRLQILGEMVRSSRSAGFAVVHSGERLSFLLPPLSIWFVSLSCASSLAATAPRRASCCAIQVFILAISAWFSSRSFSA